MQRLVFQLTVVASLSPMLAVMMAARSFQEAVQPADTVKGKAEFQRRCTGCHALDRDKEGPRLGGVYGRKAGSVAGFTYSDALRGSGVVWDQTTLDRWLTDPETIAPGNDMGFRVTDAEERTLIVRYLQVASGK